MRLSKAFHRHLTLAIAALLLVFAITACVTPLDYEVTINVHDDGSYDMHFEGSIFALLIAAALLEGTPPEEIQSEIDEMTAGAMMEPGVETFEYTEDGIFYIKGTGSFGPTETGTFLDLPFLTVRRSEGALTFMMSAGSEDAGVRDEFGLEHNGHVIVRSSTAVIESNGSQGPRGQFWNNERIMAEGVQITVGAP